MKKNNYVYIVSVIFLLLFVALSFVFKSYFKTFETTLFDYKINQSSDEGIMSKYSMPASDDIIILNADDISQYELSKLYNTYDKWPWSRSTWANIIDYVETYNPKVIGVDLIFEGYEDNSLSGYSNDMKLSNTLKKYDNIVLATEFSFPSKENLLNTDEINNTDSEILPTQFPLDVKYDNYDILKNLTYYSYTQIPNIYSNNAVLAVPNVFIDKDNKVRYFQPLFRVINQNKEYFVPSFSLALALKYINYDKDFKIKNNKLSFGKYVIPLNADTKTLINWHGKNYTYKTIPLSSVIFAIKNSSKTIKVGNEEIPPSIFKDKIVIISQSIKNANMHKTPLSDNIFSSEINATITDNIINDADTSNIVRKKFLKEPGNKIEILLTLCLCAFISVIIIRCKNYFLGFILSVLLISVYMGIIYFAFLYPEIRICFPVKLSLYFSILTIFFVSTLKKFIERNNRKVIVNLFSKIVSPKDLRKIIKNSAKLDLMPNKKIITVMNCKIENFDSIENEMNTADLVEQMNCTLDTIMDNIFFYSGAINKISPTNVIAYWGTPIEDEDAEYNAVKCALSLQEEFRHSGLNMNISLNTGEAVVGCMGAKKIMEYSVVGETIYITSKIQQIFSSSTDASILISESTYEKIKKRISTKYKGEMKIKGKALKLKIFEPIEVIDE